MQLFSLFLRSIFMAIAVCLSLTAQSQSLFIDGLQSLERFKPETQLSSVSELKIRGISVGDNVRNTVQQLSDEGGKIHYMSGGNRSEEVKVSFFQPYQTTQLEQRLEINFDPQYGLIKSIELTYLLGSAYKDINPVYQKVIEQAISRYGKPLSLEEVKAVAGSNRKEPRLLEFSEKISANDEVAEEIKAFFKKKAITPKTHFAETSDGHALLLTGFRQCLIWSKDDYAEILTLCSFQPKSGNMQAQGISLYLTNFVVQKAIANYSEQDADGIDITF